jgi:hypothetical protein
MATAAIVAAVRRNLARQLPDDVGDDLSAFKQLPNKEERLIDFALNIRLRGYVIISLYDFNSDP